MCVKGSVTLVLRGAQTEEKSATIRAKYLCTEVHREVKI